MNIPQAALEASWSGLVEKLGGDGERAKAGKLQPALFNLYRQARQAERLKEKHSLSKNSLFAFTFFFSALSVLCHGSPTPQNVVFLYKDGVPVEAKVGTVCVLKYCDLF